MSAARYLPGSDYLALKGATASLFAAAGGQSAAARTAGRVGQQQLSKYASLAEDQAECFVPLDIVADIEAEICSRGGRPVITERLAEMAGYELVPVAADGKAGLLRLFGAVGRASALAMSRMAEDLADGTISPAEARQQHQDVRAWIDALCRYEAVLAKVSGASVSVIDGGKR